MICSSLDGASSFPVVSLPHAPNPVASVARTAISALVFFASARTRFAVDFDSSVLDNSCRYYNSTSIMKSQCFIIKMAI